jgi:hypothetical protein
MVDYWWMRTKITDVRIGAAGADAVCCMQIYHGTKLARWTQSTQTLR